MSTLPTTQRETARHRIETAERRRDVTSHQLQDAQLQLQASHKQLEADEEELEAALAQLQRIDDQRRDFLCYLFENLDAAQMSLLNQAEYPDNVDSNRGKISWSLWLRPYIRMCMAMSVASILAAHGWVAEDH
ncbi:unnamed protein product [Fusarium equiseti]|uniref:Uncharacterized protein n=1 Tax=Fusarium equiseti TaxID=61235 RepID=A0A8J2NK13_FUSEQ|nr:unnamed protein product [Fusarium equiseti]